MKESLLQALRKVMVSYNTPSYQIDPASIKVEYPEDPDNGDFVSNIAMIYAGRLGYERIALSREIGQKLMEYPEVKAIVDRINPVGFINFFLKDEVVAKQILSTASSDGEYGWGSVDKGKKIMVEYTDPNPFKVFHIGHLMSNAIGESLSRLIQAQGADVKRANWQGDVGPHVAKAVWGAMRTEEMRKEKGEKGTENSDATFWGEAYTVGATAYEKDLAAKKEIDEINKKIYARSDEKINALYDKGRQESLDAFETIYKRLGTKFDNYFFEGTEGRNGEGIVKDHTASANSKDALSKDAVFEESEGAIVFKGEKYGLHTRVFVTSQGLPTYETKELGLNAEKFKIYPDLAESIIVTANEQNDYFRVLLKVLALIMPDVGAKTKHISHGLMRFASGKMSSRTGNVISAESLIEDIRKLVIGKISDRDFTPAEADQIGDEIAIGAIKYTILRSSVGSDIIFDSSASISFEGDSGPYLQYSAVRAKAVLEKAKAQGIKIATSSPKPDMVGVKVGLVEKLITRFPDIVERARLEYAPQHVAGYLITLAGAFNSFYASQTIIDTTNPLAPYYLAVTQSFLTVMNNGLWLLGIKVPKKM